MNFSMLFHNLIPVTETRCCVFVVPTKYCLKELALLCLNFIVRSFSQTKNMLVDYMVILCEMLYT